MKVSVAMATYNGASYLRAQLQSFVDQVRQPDELIITDDCSTDDTETIIRRFAITAPFKIEFYRNENNLGYCGNFNAALLKTTGDLVFLSDQDDVWFPEKIEHMIGVAERNPEALVVMNDAALTDGELNNSGLTKVGQIRSAGFSMNGFVMGCCCGVRRELLDFCLPVPASFEGHDKWLVWVADGLDARVVDDKVLQYYRRHESNESQFIANRTTKVTRTRALIHSLKSVFQQDSATNLKIQLKQLEIFLDGIYICGGKAPEKYRSQLKKLEERHREKIDTVKNRSAVRDKWLLLRIGAAVSLFARGGYSDTNGLRSVIRDILG
jgi:glycosyltransferase involved in cell wall biosynthesis